MNNLHKLFNYLDLNATEEEIYDELSKLVLGNDRWTKEGEKQKVNLHSLFTELLLEKICEVKHLPAVVFGCDNRREVVSFCDPEYRDQLIRISSGIAGVIHSESLEYQSGSNTYKLYKVAPTMQRRFKKKGLRLIDKTPFLLQPSIMTGTAFLVDDDIVLTAGHIAQDRSTKPDSIGLSFIFGFMYDEKHKIKNNSFSKFHVYHGTQILHKINNPKGDWAVIKLDRKVSGYQKCVPVHLDFNYHQKDIKVSSIGHPMGLPMKYTDNAKIKKVRDHFFEATLDTFWGNSGSPVITDIDGKLGMIGIMSSTSGRYVLASGNCGSSKPPRIKIDKNNLNMVCQKINKEIQKYLPNQKI